MNAIDRATYATVTSLDQLDDIIRDAFKAGVACIDTETTGLDAHHDELVGIALTIRPGSGFYIPLAHDEGDNLPLDDVLKKLKPLLEHPTTMKVGQNLKFDVHFFRRHGITLGPFEDSMLMAYSMYGGKHYVNMDELSMRYLNYTPISFKEVTGGGKISFNKVPIDQATEYAAEDTDITMRLAYLFGKHFERDDDGLRIYTDLERPLVQVLADMEARGVMVDVPYLGRLTDEFAKHRDAALDEAEAMVSHEFNPASPQQVAAVLNKMNVRIDERTDSGQIATGVEVLNEIVQRDDVSPEAKTLVKAILEYRKFNKLIGTYTEGMAEHADPDTSRIHPSFKQAHTTTGRLSCEDPNLQNIPSPARTEEGKLIRRAFIAKPGHKLISADYSQIELRIAAHASGDDAMFKAFDSGHDFHKATAAFMYDIPIDAVGAVQRRNAKAINFGIIYGKTAWGLARDLGISEDEAGRMIEGYFKAYPALAIYMNRAKNFARDRGYVQTIAGRKIWINDIHASNTGRRRHAERAAINAPIQGTAADVIKAAMINAHDILESESWETRMLLQVHDELIFEAPDDEVEEVLPVIKSVMESSVSYLDLPLAVDAKAADNWRDAH